jgi:hypothetical protein
MDINIEIIPIILELYNHVSYQSIIDILLQNLLIDTRYNHVLLDQRDLYTVISIYIYRGLRRLLTCMESHGTLKIEDDIIATLLDFVYIYMLNNEFNDKTMSTFHDCLFVLVNCAYYDYIQPEFIPVTIQLYETSSHPETKYLVLNYLYNIHHDKLFKRYLIYNKFTSLVNEFVNDTDCKSKYVNFCKILENEFV